MHCPTAAKAAPLFGALILGAAAVPLLARPPERHAGTVIPLPADDRATLEQYFGHGVVGEPVEAFPIDDPTEYVGLEHAQQEWVQRVYGDNTGSISEIEIAALNRPGRDAWKMKTSTEVLFGEQDKTGSLIEHSSQDLSQGVLSRFDPPEPILAKGIAPGQSITRHIQVAVYDLSNTKDETHSGELDLTYTYIGAYKIAVPAGVYESVLFKWDYNGKVGPASVKDSQYWFFVKGIGPAATISRQNISAFLIYNKNTKAADVLAKRQD